MERRHVEHTWYQHHTKAGRECECGLFQSDQYVALIPPEPKPMRYGVKLITLGYHGGRPVRAVITIDNRTGEPISQLVTGTPV